MAAAGFRVFEHTADVGVEAWGVTLAETVAQAVRGMNAVHAGEGLIEVTRDAEASAEGHDAESLLYNLLSEVLFVMETEGLVIGEATVKLAPRAAGGWTAVAKLRGEPQDPQRHQGLQVKAVTYHELSVVEEEKGWRARVILDI